MRVTRRFLPLALAIATLSVPALALAQDMMMGPLGTRDVAPHGTILTNAEGRTVYSWASDVQGAGTSACYDACAGPWPAVVVDEATMMSSMPGMSMDSMMTMSGVGFIQRTDGAYQVTYNGWPLYTFQRDAAPGDVAGHGSTGFGGLWQVVPAAM